MADTKTETTAAELRAAANTLREAVKNATAGPWTAGKPSWAGANAVLNGDGHPVTICGEEVEGADHPASADAAWIALVSPALAEPLASWLEQAAEEFGREVITDTPECPNCGEGCAGHEDALVHDDGCGNWLADADAPGLRCECFDRPLAVARVLNGSTS